MSKKFFFSVLLIVSSSIVVGQAKKTVTINGFAPAYIGKKVEIFEIQDYFSFTEGLLASSTVTKDSIFSIQFECNKTQKVIIKSNNNRAYLYIQPNGVYDVYFPEKDKYDPYRPTGNTVEVSFYGLDSTDINYKILGFQRWQDDFLGTYFYTKKVNGVEFAIQLDKFKANVEKAYATDTNSFFKTFVKFSIASLDDIQQSAARNRYEKHDFYIKFSPVSYENDVYMEYISKFYANMAPRLSFETSNDVYLAVLKSSPTRLMKALGGEFTMINLKIREMIMVRMLSEVYYSGDFPQSNIITIMDSVANHAMFSGTKIIAKNMKNRLLELVPGGKAPTLALKAKDGSIKTIESYGNKHIYLHFFDPSNIDNVTEISFLNALQEKYKEDIQFLTIYKRKETYSDQEKKVIESIKWDAFEVNGDDPIFNSYQIMTFPSYVLLDGYGYIVASPALGPRPNGEGINIDKTFFYIHKVRSEEK